MKTKIFFNKAYLYATLALILIIIPFYALFFMTPQQRIIYTREDGLIENLSAIFFLMASIVCFIVFAINNSEEKRYILKSKRNYFYLLLGLFLFVCFGEEISWGERIFGFATPENLKAINVQGEVNIHNLKYLSSMNMQLVQKEGIAKWLDAAHLFSYVWLFYCLIIPISIKFSSKISVFINKIHLPVVPIFLGILFLTNYLIFKSLESTKLFTIQTINEIKESNSAFLFLLVSVSLYLKYKTEIRIRPINSSL